jgi:hypothetical protein
MSQDEAVAKFLASVLALWARTPADEIAAMGSVAVLLEMGSSVRVTAAEGSSAPEREAEPMRRQVGSRSSFAPFRSFE